MFFFLFLILITNINQRYNFVIYIKITGKKYHNITKHNYTHLLNVKIIKKIFYFCIKGCISEKQNRAKLEFFRKVFSGLWYKKSFFLFIKKNYAIIKLILISMFKKNFEKKNIFGEKVVQIKKQKKHKIFIWAPLNKSNPNSMDLKKH